MILRNMELAFTNYGRSEASRSLERWKNLFKPNCVSDYKFQVYCFLLKYPSFQEKCDLSI